PHPVLAGQVGARRHPQALTTTCVRTAGLRIIIPNHLLQSRDRPMPATFADAVQLHKDSKFDQAELIYRNILDDEPNHAEVLHLLGVLLHQRGQSAKAIRFIKKAVTLLPQAPVFYCNLAEACRAAGDLNEAVANSKKALKLQPDNADAHNHLGLALQGLA